MRRVALTQWRYARTRRTWMMQIVSVHAVQTSRRNASRPWDVLRTITATRETRQPLRTKAGNAINRSVLDALSMPYRRASRTRTRPSPRTTAPVVADMCQPGSVQQQRLPSHRPRGSKLRGSQLRGSTFRGKRRQHGASCPLGTARFSARPQESSNIMWHRTTNDTSTGRSWDNRHSE